MFSDVFLMTHMNFGVYPSKTRETTVNISVSGSSRRTWNCIFTHSEEHPGLPSTLNTNLLWTSLRNWLNSWFPWSFLTVSSYTLPLSSCW
jgi:hypothetical protein